MKTDTTSVHSYGYLARSFLRQQKKNALFEHSSVSCLMSIASHIHIFRTFITNRRPKWNRKSDHELLVKLEQSLQKMTLELSFLRGEVENLQETNTKLMGEINNCNQSLEIMTEKVEGNWHLKLAIKPNLWMICGRKQMLWTQTRTLSIFES